MPFRRLKVTHDVRFTTLVTWELEAAFADPAPYRYQLQVSRTGGATADDWEDVGPVAEDAAFLADDTQRLFGKNFTLHYRIILETPRGTYTSPPASTQTDVPFRDWRLSREIYRKERRRLKQYVGVEGALLKLRRYGAPCPTCVNSLTGATQRSRCPTCYGTGYRYGYFAPLFDVWLDRNPIAGWEHVDLQAEGSVNQVVVALRLLGTPQVASRDILVERRSGRRWNIEKVEAQAELRGLPVVTQVELRLLPLKDVLYGFPVTFL